MAPTTTSATRHGRSRKTPDSAVLPRRAPRRRRAARGGRAGFTLVEILLAACLVAALVGLVVISTVGWYDSSLMPEGARQFESILTLARAEASAGGRRIRLVFDAETLDASVLWEPSPLEEPGTFVPYGGEWAHNLPNNLVRVRRCQRIGASAYQTLTYQDGDEMESEDGEIIQPVTFYPDGSCDSAVIELVGRVQAEQRTALIELDGTTGGIRLRIMGPTELEEYLEESESL